MLTVNKKNDEIVRSLMEEMFHIQLKSNNFMRLLTFDMDLSENLVLLMLRLKLFGFLKITQIAEVFLLTPGAATNMCDKLERLGYAERIRLQDDRRIVRVALTKKGEDRIDTIFSKLSEEQLLIITNTLAEINKLLQNIEDIT